jgi:hypothetical protein
MHILNGLLECYALPKTRVLCDINAFSRRMITFSVRKAGGAYVGDCNVNILHDFAYIEGWYNLKVVPKIGEKLEEAITDNVLLQMLIAVETELPNNPLKFALFCRAFQTDTYRRCSFRIEGRTFSCFDSIIRAISAIRNRQSRMNQTNFDLEIVESECGRFPFVPKPFVDEAFAPVFELCCMIKRKAPRSFAINARFVQNTVEALANAFNTLTMTAPAAQLFYAYPEVFPFESRLFAFRAIACEPNMSVKLLHKTFWASETKVKYSTPVVQCTVSRAAIFEQGCFLLNRLGPGRFRPQFAFEDEYGFGEGPSQEFFDKMAMEFGQMEMWRKDNEGRLFPVVDVDTSLLEILGFLCAKAIVLSKVVYVPFSNCFFKLVCGKKVCVREIDDVFGNSLNYKEGLYELPFVYPGTSLELKPHGKSLSVNKENVDEYVRLVESYTCGQVMASKIHYFVRALETNIQKEALEIFTSEEIVSLLCGDGNALTIEGLRENVVLEHGYNAKSIEIEWLFRILVELSAEMQRLFIRFVTGSSRLPFGGIGNLRPHLTVAKRVAEADGDVDGSLPSVMTCTNYLKLPPYSNMEKMREKLVTAITECQNSFMMS